MEIIGNIRKFLKISLENFRGHPGLNRGPLDLQSNALPLSYTPTGYNGTVWRIRMHYYVIYW
ncbi:hypothetical protein T12_9839 [Trichinella patagoniensis]|uniref:Uncharacterized protein n=1 Tax=Trichinella patagoniensis TaxID=990121 RepID=A0A0V0ZJJ3_9BILA|nr:hypothetical protein T12_9839 [Trichinella patagoniensis]